MKTMTSFDGSQNQTASHNCTLPYEVDRVPLVVLYSMVVIIGLPANVATVYMTFLQVRRKNVLGIYLLSLSLCDLMYLCTLPLWMIYVSQAHEWNLGSLACKITGYIFFNNMYISIFLLCCVSIDRYVAVVYAVESRGIRQQKLAGVISVGVYLLVALSHVPVFTMREGDTDKGPRRCFEPGQSSATVAGFNYARFVIGFLIPLSVLVVTNRAILINIQASPGLRSSQKVKVKYLAIAVIIFFLVCFAPYHIILLLRAVAFHFPDLHKNCDFLKSIYTPYTIFLGLSTINSATNPILYVLASDNIRKEIKQSLASLSGRTALQPRLTDSSQHKMQSSDAATHKDIHSC
ncbi:putative G-protein coupled receptor 132b [Scleropages formosus]|nr:probable G-protein coupled receptor 132 [Scleropages formosus]XP_018583288.2 probable G-protein coupled receptor 132 [Scleropages formosus]XP_018583289.2 probable G-protein coupled receptor 132 [Scleropages formosus]